MAEDQGSWAIAGEHSREDPLPALLEGLMMFRPGRTLDHDTAMHWFVWSLTELPMRMANTWPAITEMLEND